MAIGDTSKTERKKHDAPIGAGHGNEPSTSHVKTRRLCHIQQQPAPRADREGLAQLFCAPSLQERLHRQINKDDDNVTMTMKRKSEDLLCAANVQAPF